MARTLSAAVAVQADPCADAAEPVARAVSNGLPPARFAGRIGSMLGERFVVQALLGPGESGDYYAALDMGVGGLQSALGVVIKLKHAAVGDAASLEAFRHEYNQARRLSNPGIARVFDFIADSGEVGYTLDLPPGAALADRLPPPLQGRLSRNYAWALISATGRALVHAHLRNVVHGALSMRSLWLTEERQVRLLEFGSRPIPTESGQTQAGQSEPRRVPWSADVARYASCEVLEGFAPTPSDDLYSLSCLAYELLAGQHPWAGADASCARDRALRPARPPGLKSSEWRVLKAGIALSPQRRPSSVREWLAALHLALKDERLPELSVVPLPKAPGNGREVALAVAGCAALGCAFWGWHAARHDTRAPIPVTVNSGDPVVTAPRLAVDESTLPPAMPAQPAGAASLPPSPPVDPRAETGTAAKASPTRTRSLPIGNGLSFSQAQYTVARRSRFVEIRVLRRGSVGEAEFQWWTEADTALEGQDFQAQTPAMQTLRAGASATSLFVRIPESKAAHRRFRVCAKSESPAGASVAACTQVLL